MIRKFHVLYVGQIELDNVGLDGTPADERRYSDERLREAYFTARDVAQLMDELGFDVLWAAEHHFQREGYEVLPNLLILAVHLAHVTKRLKVGCGFNIAPMWHPLRLAEDYAVAVEELIVRERRTVPDSLMTEVRRFVRRHSRRLARLLAGQPVGRGRQNRQQRLHRGLLGQ